MPFSAHPTTNLQPVLDAIAELKADVPGLKQVVSQQGVGPNNLAEAIAQQGRTLDLQGMSLRAIAKVILPADAMVDEASGPDAADKLKRKRESQLRGRIAPPRYPPRWTRHCAMRSGSNCLMQSG